MAEEHKNDDRQSLKDLAHMDEHIKAAIESLHEGNMPAIRISLALSQGILKKTIERERAARRKNDEGGVR